jgi:lysozyme
MKWTKEQADKTFNREVNKFARRVSSMLTNYANANQLGAMTSLAYNIGLDAFKNKSTVFKAHNADDAEAAARAFSLWNKARVNGVLVPLRGLTLRRTKEAALYLSPEFSTVEDVGVQAVQEESNLTKSPINVGGATSVAAGSVAGVSAVLNEFTPVLDQAKDLAMTFSINPGIVFAVILIGGGAATMYWRYKQRKGGWA